MTSDPEVAADLKAVEDAELRHEQERDAEEAHPCLAGPVCRCRCYDEGRPHVCGCDCPRSS